MDNSWTNIKKKLSSQKNITSLGVANISGSAISAILWLYFGSVMEPSEYGELHYFIAIASVAQIFSLIGGSNAITVYAAKKIQIHTSLFLISLLVGLASTIFVLGYFLRFDVSILIFGYLIFELMNALLLGQKHYAKYSKFFVLQKSLMLILGISFFHLLGFDTILYGFALSFSPYLIIIFNEFRTVKINFDLLKTRSGFIINNYAISISGRIGSSIDKVIIAPLLGFTLLGNYSLALQLFVILLIIPSIIFKYILPEDSTGNSNKKLKQFLIILSVGLAISGMILSPYVIPSFFPKFVDAVEAFQIMSIAIIPTSIKLLYTSKFLSLEKSKFVLIGTIISSSIIIIGFLVFGPLYGIIALAVIFVLSDVSDAIFLFCMSKTKQFQNRIN
tara:strand:+ start:29 stop:1198 length:1170 start_codon:yes stop_codon:yes gene_type:complete